MPRSLEKSNQHFKKALTKMPLGVSSNFRYWGEDKTIYVDHGRGGRIQDIDGNNYVDYRMGYGPGILGYADPRVDEAARAGMEIGGVFALSTEREYEVAKRIPFGRVTSYGAIAKYLGAARSARMVGYAMNNSHAKDIPAHRVVNRKGLLTGKHHFEGTNLMQQLLESEGVEVIDNQIQDFEKLFWDPSNRL